MVGKLHRNRSLFYFALEKQASRFQDPLLDRIDVLLDDPGLVEMVTDKLGSRSSRSRQTGRHGMPPDCALRACVLKHLRGWSYRELVRELNNGIVYRQFTRFADAPIPDFSVFARTFGLFGTDLTRAIHSRIVTIANERLIAPGRKMRTDTTVVETNIHYPTDSTLLSDGVRVLTRTIERIGEQCRAGAVKVVNHTRSVKHRVLEIHRAAKSFTSASRDRLVSGYEKLLGITRSVANKGRKVLQEIEMGVLPVTGDYRYLMLQESALRHFIPLVEKVIAQTKARVLEGHIRFPGKLVSIFEPHTEIIRKGKVHKPTEFGRLVRIDEVENGIVSNYEVADGNPADVNQWGAAIEGHIHQFGHPPDTATADRGYYSAHNEKQATDLGVRRVAIPARGKLSKVRAKLQKQRWFKRALRWRAGVEARIATLKHRLGMARACYKNDTGFKRHVGWSVIANNAVAIARAQIKRSGQEKKQHARAA